MYNIAHFRSDKRTVESEPAGGAKRRGSVMQRLARLQQQIGGTHVAAVGDRNEEAALAALLSEARAGGALTWRQVFVSEGGTASTASPRSAPAGPLTPAQYEAYWRDGYVVVPIPSDVSLDDLKSAVDDLVELNAANLVANGRLTQTDYEATLGAPVETRQALIEQLVPGSSWELFSRSCNGPSSKLNRSPPVRQLQSSAGMMAIVRQLLSADDIDLTGAFSFRCKCPNHNMTDQVGASGGEWHQDLAYGSPDSEETIAVTGWLPLQATDAKMGTIRVISGGHRTAYRRGNGHTLPHHVGWVLKAPFLHQFLLYQNYHFTKTGSGQA